MEKYFPFKAYLLDYIKDDNTYAIQLNEYTISIRLTSNSIFKDFLIDFDHVKKIMKKICNSLNEKKLISREDSEKTTYSNVIVFDKPTVTPFTIAEHILDDYILKMKEEHLEKMKNLDNLTIQIKLNVLGSKMNYNIEKKVEI